ncbi:MAG: hypothetical protein DLM55_00290 [Acidimicrobiales bacterium]|nr:MAG: hypothetical protein DLM55_00290 [Acidimicrobiales bacterium]
MAFPVVAPLVPIGQFIGTMFAGPVPASNTAGQAQSWGYGVRLGTELEDLNESEFGIWALSHGTGNDKVNTASRGAVEKLARQLDIADAQHSTDALLQRGLLARVLPVAAQARGFAQHHQLMPLGMGLGNSASALGAFTIGQPGFPRATVSAVIFDVWAFSAQGASLWQACEKTADWGEELTPESLALLVLQALPVLLATDAAYIDVC